MDHANQQTTVTVLSLISGTRNPVLMTIVLGLLLAGLGMIFRLSRITGVAIVLPFILFSAVMAVTTQDGAHAGIQVARYGITFLPLSFVAISVALVWIGKSVRTKFSFFQRKHLLLTVAVAAWIPFLASSPLWTTYSQPNNFTNHSAYQYRYDPIQWLQRSPERDLVPGISMEYRNIPRFYLQSPIVSTAKGIIEYPVLIGDQLNLYYYYQHFHRRPVAAGFVSNNIYAPFGPGRDFVYGDWPIDSVMGGMPELLRNKSSWNTMADLNNITMLRSKYKGWLVLIHRDPLSELFRNNSPDNPMTMKLVDRLTGAFGSPLFVDGQLAAWMIE
jgi:hypothetical protein